jgi:redox-sensing transcriptional repressor
MEHRSDDHHKHDLNGIPHSTIRRLPVYHRYLSDLNRKEVERVSSRELAAKMGINPSQLRQDLGHFGSFGQQGYGYRVVELLGEIDRILGLNQGTTMVIIGAGHLGMALANYEHFTEYGFRVAAVFDNDPQKIGRTVDAHTVQNVAELGEFLAKTPVAIGVITTPTEVAQSIADRLVEAGVKAIWNFAPVNLKVPERIILEHMHISESLFLLSYKLQQNNAAD